MLEKMEYIHNNPVNKAWNLADDRADYKWSSACYYDYEKSPCIEIDPLMSIPFED